MASQRDLAKVESGDIYITSTLSTVHSLSTGYKKIYLRGVVLYASAEPTGGIELHFYDMDTYGTAGGEVSMCAWVNSTLISPTLTQDASAVIVGYSQITDFVFIDDDSGSQEIHFALRGVVSQQEVRLKFYYEADVNMA